VIVCPSNPYLSIDPILAVPGVRQGLARLGAPIVAVSPIVGGRALKGPAAKLMTELGASPCIGDLVAHYGGLLSGLVVDHADADEAEALEVLGLPTHATGAVMHSDADRVRLALETFDFALDLGARARRRVS
jgi:LPPG:FO 2-phospho-L-lactate transferase